MANAHIRGDTQIDSENKYLRDIPLFQSLTYKVDKTVCKTSRCDVSFVRYGRIYQLTFIIIPTVTVPIGGHLLGGFDNYKGKWTNVYGSFQIGWDGKIGVCRLNEDVAYLSTLVEIPANNIILGSMVWIN